VRAVRVGLAVLGLLALAGPARAHALGAECKVVGGRVEVEAYYDDDTPARDAKVSVRDAAQKVIVEGRTDERGCWSFPQPAAGKYEVVVDAGAGHRATVKVTVTGDPPAGPPQVVSDGPTREEFTRTPWLKVAIGLAAIAVLAGAFWLSRQAGKKTRE
jgi:nickel transport protein